VELAPEPETGAAETAPAPTEPEKDGSMPEVEVCVEAPSAPDVPIIVASEPSNPLNISIEDTAAPPPPDGREKPVAKPSWQPSREMFFGVAGVAGLLLVGLILVIASGGKQQTPDPAPEAQMEPPVTPVPHAAPVVADDDGPAPDDPAPSDEATPPPEPIAQGEANDESQEPKSKSRATGVARRSATSETPPAPRQADEEAADAKGQLSVRSTPSGQVSVNGRTYGYTPITIGLPPGNYTVVVTHPEYGSQTVSTRVIAKKTMMVNVDL
jgi:hypothetical protein